jgi:hypothetical protein
MWGALSSERMGLPLATAAGYRQRRHSRVRVPRDSRPHSLVSDSRPPSKSQSQSHTATDGQSFSKSWCRAPGRMTSSLVLVWPLRSCFCVAPSLTRGRVCLLYMLLVLASVVCLGSESLGTRDHILLSQIWDLPPRRLQLTKVRGEPNRTLLPQQRLTPVCVFVAAETHYNKTLTSNGCLCDSSPISQNTKLAHSQYTSWRSKKYRLVETKT